MPCIIYAQGIDNYHLNQLWLEWLAHFAITKIMEQIIQ